MFYFFPDSFFFFFSFPSFFSFSSHRKTNQEEQKTSDSNANLGLFRSDIQQPSLSQSTYESLTKALSKTSIEELTNESMNEKLTKGRRACIHLVLRSETLLRTRREELGNIFDAYDADASAAMSASELKVLLDDIAENGASDGSGVSGYGSQTDGNPQADDDDGGEQERRALASAVVLSEEDLEMFIAAMDANGDGRLGRDEFLDYCMRGMNMRSKQRKKFAKRSPMHAKLQLFIANILKRIEDQ